MRVMPVGIRTLQLLIDEAERRVVGRDKGTPAYGQNTEPNAVIDDPALPHGHRPGRDHAKAKTRRRNQRQVIWALEERKDPLQVRGYGLRPL